MSKYRSKKGGGRKEPLRPRFNCGH
jgi:hypothetical protein